MVIYNPKIESFARLHVDRTNKTILYDTNTFECVWLIEGTDVWYAKTTLGTEGYKVMGEIPLPKKADVFFLSYDEPNAEENWQRLLTKAPHAKRIHGVKGIGNAHSKAARQSSTHMFYVVDGDCWIADDFEFDYKPDVFDLGTVHLWYSKNPVNDLVYGHGGVKMFPRTKVMNLKEWFTDFTTSFDSLKVIEEISCEERFNTSAFATWRTAFRECVKLNNNGDTEKINAWLNPDMSKMYAKESIIGSEQGIAYTGDISKINDFDWLKEMYD